MSPFVPAKSPFFFACLRYIFFLTENRLLASLSVSCPWGEVAVSPASFLLPFLVPFFSVVRFEYFFVYVSLHSAYLSATKNDKHASLNTFPLHYEDANNIPRITRLPLISLKKPKRHGQKRKRG